MSTLPSNALSRDCAGEGCGAGRRAERGQGGAAVPGRAARAWRSGARRGGARRGAAGRRAAGRSGARRRARLVQLADRRVQLLGLAVHLLLQPQLLYLLPQVRHGAGGRARRELRSRGEDERDQLVQRRVHALRARALLLDDFFCILQRLLTARHGWPRRARTAQGPAAGAGRWGAWGRGIGTLWGPHAPAGDWRRHWRPHGARRTPGRRPPPPPPPGARGAPRPPHLPALACEPSLRPWEHEPPTHRPAQPPHCAPKPRQRARADASPDMALSTPAAPPHCSLPFCPTHPLVGCAAHHLRPNTVTPPGVVTREGKTRGGRGRGGPPGAPERRSTGRTGPCRSW
jgi:hypothetical protein